MRSISACVAALALVGLTACGEKPQDLNTAAKPDEAAYQGTGVAAFTAPGWKPGDANSWAQELRARGQYGQNDYTRVQSK